MHTINYIPPKIKVGYKLRDDTFTKKLGFVVYVDNKDVIRQETSWNNWRSKDIPVDDFDNIPKNGFIINKGVQRRNYNWNSSGRSMARIFHPDGFEFEISIDNLMAILFHSDINKQEIVEQCVLAWFGKDLVLVPTNSEIYINSLEHTKNQSINLDVTDLEVGQVYVKKTTKINLEKRDNDFHQKINYYGLIYLGHFNYRNSITGKFAKKHVFADDYNDFKIHKITDLLKVDGCKKLDSVNENINKLNNSYHIQKVNFELFPISNLSRQKDHISLYKHIKDDIYFCSDDLDYNGYPSLRFESDSLPLSLVHLNLDPQNFSCKKITNEDDIYEILSDIQKNNLLKDDKRINIEIIRNGSYLSNSMRFTAEVNKRVFRYNNIIGGYKELEESGFKFIGFQINKNKYVLTGTPYSKEFSLKGLYPDTYIKKL